MSRMDRTFRDLSPANIIHPPREVRSLVRKSIQEDIAETFRLFYDSVVIIAPFFAVIMKWSPLSMISICGIAYDNLLQGSYRVANGMRLRVKSLHQATKLFAAISMLCLCMTTLGGLPGANTAYSVLYVIGQSRTSIHLGWLSSGMELIAPYVGCTVAAVVHNTIKFWEADEMIGSVAIAFTTLLISIWFLKQKLESKIRAPEPVRNEDGDF
ncbi:hypothetical protein CRE_15178 [Caenorhabditis remanei]|uniref:Uncharacterized protein n=1 Tax=Caenorhabditis remanei TaxID=31234 RepID=E3NPE5_CAERE|nr:hypothetical protein CRE_15178 [Caenorhabditis remanei]